MMPFQVQQQRPDSTVQRGKKATIVQLYEDTNHEMEEEKATATPSMISIIPPTKNHHHHDYNDNHDHDDNEDTRTRRVDVNHSAVRNKKQHRFRSFVERMVSNPLLSMFTCDGERRSRSSTTPLQNAIQAGAPKAIVQTMKQFPYQCRIQRMGCGGLRDLAVDSWPMKQRIVEAHGVETILKAMRIHCKDAPLQELALKCLYELVAGDLPEHLVERGVVGVVLQTMEAHAQEEEVLEMACNVLLALTDNGPGGIECIRYKLGGVILARLEHSFRGQNGDISKKAGELLRRLYL